MAEDLRLADEQPQGRAVGFDAVPLSVIWPLLGRHIAFHRRLVDLTSSVKTALLLSQSVYWTRHGRDIAQTGIDLSQSQFHLHVNTLSFM